MANRTTECFLHKATPETLRETDRSSGVNQGAQVVFPNLGILTEVR